MIEGSALTEQLNIILKQKFRRHICSILYGDEKYIGTGNLVQHRNQLFILTCHHVAVEAYTFRNLEIIFPDNKALKQNQITLFRKNKNDDIALLRIDETNFKLGDLATSYSWGVYDIN